MRRFRAFTMALLFAGAAANCFGSLIFQGVVTIGGTGLGNVNTLLTVQSPGATSTETGCVGVNGAGATVTGPSVCPTGSGIAGGNEQAQNNTFAVSNLSNQLIVFNGSEPGSGPSVTLDKLVLTIFTTTGVQLASFSTTGLPQTFADFPGVGNSGFAFRLDAAQGATANAVLAANPTARVGLGASLSNAQGGLETFFLVPVTAVVPEPGTITLFCGGIALLALGRRRNRTNA